MNIIEDLIAVIIYDDISLSMTITMFAYSYRQIFFIQFYIRHLNISSRSIAYV